MSLTQTFCRLFSVSKSFFMIYYNFFFVCRIAVYKALYRLFGGFVADVVAAIDQVHSVIC